MIQNNYTYASQCDKKQSLLVWLFVLIIFVSIPPFFFWSISSIISVIASFGFFFYGLWKKPQNQFRRISLFLFIIFYLYTSLNVYGQFNFVGRLWNGYRLLITFTIFFISDENWTIIYKRFLTIYVVTLIPSLIVYFSAIWVGIDLPHTFLSPLNELKDHGYYAYPFMVISEGLENFRFCGYYDEPGVIGNISGVLLIVNRCNMRDWKNWILLISGIFSFSLYFYGIVSLYIFFFGSKEVKIALILLVVVAMTYLATSDNVFSNLILARLEMGDDGGLAGDNRTQESFNFFYKRFLDSDMLWFGYGQFYSSTVVDTGGQSYKHLIVDHGIIMSILYIVAFFFYYISYNVKKKHLMFLLLILFSILFQRPFILYILYLFLMISPAAMIRYTFEKEKAI